MPFHENIINKAQENTLYRDVIYTTERTQLVLMSIPINQDIGEEVHHLDQIIFFVSGQAESILNGKVTEALPSDIVVIPAGTKHNIRNIGDTDLKLFTIYAPPAHPPHTRQVIKD